MATGLEVDYNLSDLFTHEKACIGGCGEDQNLIRVDGDWMCKQCLSRVNKVTTRTVCIECGKWFEAKTEQMGCWLPNIGYTGHCGCKVKGHKAIHRMHENCGNDQCNCFDNSLLMKMMFTK